MEEKDLMKASKKYADKWHQSNGIKGIIITSFKAGAEWMEKEALHRIVNHMFNLGYSYDSIAEALDIECPDVVDMLDLD